MLQHCPVGWRESPGAVLLAALAWGRSCCTAALSHPPFFPAHRRDKGIAPPTAIWKKKPSAQQTRETARRSSSIKKWLGEGIQIHPAACFIFIGPANVEMPLIESLEKVPSARSCFPGTGTARWFCVLQILQLSILRYLPKRCSCVVALCVLFVRNLEGPFPFANNVRCDPGPQIRTSSSSSCLVSRTFVPYLAGLAASK